MFPHTTRCHELPISTEMTDRGALKCPSHPEGVSFCLSPDRNPGLPEGQPDLLWHWGARGSRVGNRGNRGKFTTYFSDFSSHKKLMGLMSVEHDLQL